MCRMEILAQYLHIWSAVDQYMCTVFEIIFENLQQKHLDKTIFHQQFVNFAQKKEVSQTTIVPIYGL